MKTFTDDERECLEHALLHLEENYIHRGNGWAGWYTGIESNKAKFIKRHIAAIAMLREWVGKEKT